MNFMNRSLWIIHRSQTLAFYKLYGPGDNGMLPLRQLSVIGRLL